MERAPPPLLLVAWLSGVGSDGGAAVLAAEVRRWLGGLGDVGGGGLGDFVKGSLGDVGGGGAGLNLGRCAAPETESPDAVVSAVV